MTQVCIVGAGAIGGFIGARLAAAEQCDLSALARGQTLQALREHGWRLRQGRDLLQRPARAEAQADRLGPQDLVIVAVKGPALTEVARAMEPLIGPHTVVMPAMNGVPWWFCSGQAGFGSPLESVDPGGLIAKAIPMAQVLGCVVHASSSVLEPGLVQHRRGQGLILGEPMGGRSARLERTASLLTHAGLDVTISDRIRHDIWYKLWGNLTMNPVSALTGATTDRILADPLVRDFCSAVMAEAQAVGARIACPIEQRPEDRHHITAELGAFKTSMLQDVEAGRAVELDAILGAVLDIAKTLGMTTPNMQALMGLTRLFAQGRGLYP